MFWIFFCFPYKAHNSATFQPTCQKWRSGSSSGLPVSESAQFQKQTRIFNTIFEKKNFKINEQKISVEILVEISRWFLSRKMWGQEIFYENLQNFSYLKKKKLGKEGQLMTIVKEISQQYKETDDSLKGFKRGRCSFWEFCEGGGGKYFLCPISCHDYWCKNPNRLKMFKTCILNTI